MAHYVYSVATLTKLLPQTMKRFLQTHQGFVVISLTVQSSVVAIRSIRKLPFQRKTPLTVRRYSFLAFTSLDIIHNVVASSSGDSDFGVKLNCVQKIFSQSYLLMTPASIPSQDPLKQITSRKLSLTKEFNRINDLEVHQSLQILTSLSTRQMATRNGVEVQKRKLNASNESLHSLPKLLPTKKSNWNRTDSPA